MKKLTCAAILTALGLVVLHTQVGAQTDLSWNREVDVTDRSVPNSHQSAKFNEYRDLRTGVYLDMLKLGYAHRAKYMDFTATKVGRDDQRYVLSGGQWGRFRGSLSYDSIPHNFAFNALSMYTPASLGTSSLTLIGPRTTTAGAAAWFPANSAPVDIGLIRKTTAGDISFDATSTIKLNFGISREERDGDRPFFGSFGIGGPGTMEIAEPIDYTTTIVRTGVDYAHANTFLNLVYSSSVFDNHISSVSWDNPFQAVDGPATLNGAGTTLTSAPGRGQAALSPSNRAHNWALTGAVARLPWKSTLSASFNRGEMTQNDALLPMTINSQILTSSLLSPAERAALAAVPVSANLKVNTSLDTVTWTARPVNRFSLKARYRRYHYDNKSPAYTFPYIVTVDNTVPTAAAPLTTEPPSYETVLGNLDGQYDLTRSTKLLLNYKSDKITRVNRQVPTSTERGPLIGIEHRSNGWLTLKGTYESLDRTGAHEVSDVLPELLFYDQAARKSQRLRLEATASLNDRLTLSANAGYSKFHYPENSYGRLDYNMGNYELEADYDLKSGASTYAYYSHETYKTNQAGNQNVTVAGVVTHNTWNALSRDVVHTIGLGISGKSPKNRLTYRADLGHSWTKGTIGFASRVPTNPTPVPWDNVDSDRLDQLTLSAKYSMQHNLDLTAGIIWERFKLTDFDNNAPNVPTTKPGVYNGAILMGTLPANYNAKIVYAGVGLKF